MRSAERKHCRVLHGAALIDAQSSGLGANIDQSRTVLLIVFSQRRFRGRKLLEDHVGNDQSGAIYGVNSVLARGHRAGNDMDFDCQPGSGHPDGIVNAILVVNDEFLRQAIDNFAAGRELNRAS